MLSQRAFCRRNVAVLSLRNRFYCGAAVVLLSCRQASLVYMAGSHSLVALVAHLQPSVVVSLLLASVFVGADEVFVIPFLTFAVVMALMPLIVALSKRFLPRISGYRDLISPEKIEYFTKYLRVN